jgi:5S rRNA maturation endonuclease (ribonuclease M5)
MDFLTYLKEEGVVKVKEDILVLNSLSFQQRGEVFIENGLYDQIMTFFDNDQKGRETTEIFKMYFGGKLKPQNYRYTRLWGCLRT